MKLEKSVYIPSIEASDLYSYMFRDKEIKLQYIGMIPSSLELNKLIEIGLKIHKAKTSDKALSDDVINVKFRQKVHSGDEIIEKNIKKIEGLDEKRTQYKQKLIDFNELIEKEKDSEKWNEVKNDDLRQSLYVDEFVYEGHRYVVYKRSSAKSRVGQCLFIKEHLYNEMINWSRMNLPLDKAQIDYPSLLAYESLVGSSIESLIQIKPENILIVDDVESRFKQLCNVVRTGENGYLDSFTEEVEISNNLFDGQSLLDSSFFPNGKAMLLLRNHMFKSAAFNCNIQLYLKDNCPNGVNYDEWTLTDMFGNKILAKDVHLIITPSSLKSLKFSHVKGTEEKDMFAYWKSLLQDEGSMFGVCKSEKRSKHGMDDEGKVIQQTSYQMINCLPASKTDIQKLAKFECQYIEKLKNDDDSFIEHITKSANSINGNQMFVELYKRNKDIVHTKLFRDFRKAEINNHVTHVKKGKLRLVGDYLTLLGNPMEFLAHSIGSFDSKKTALKGNEIYTTQFDFNKDLVGFRNPNTSPSNVLVARNIYNAEIDTYFNLSDNVVAVNAIGFPLQDILSGSDYDSDTILLLDDPHMLELGLKCFGKYRVCINKVASSKKQYELTKLDMSKIDSQLATSQMNIGRVVNLGQLCMSTYWDLLEKGKSEKELEELLKKIDVMTVLSGICIDLAKKFYDIDIQKEINHVAKTKELRKEKPLFWKFVSENKDVKTEVYNCPMDHLFNVMSKLPNAKHRENINFTDLLVKQNINNGNRKQEKKLIDYVEAMKKKIDHINASTLLDEEENINAIEDIFKFYEFYVSKLTVKPDTMYALLIKTAKNNNKIACKLMNILFKTQTECFVNAFKK